MDFRTVVIENPCRCSYKGGYLVVRKENDTAMVHLSEIYSLLLSTNQVYMSAYLASELAKAKIPVIFCDEKHNPVAELLPLYGAHNMSKRLEEQLEWTEPSKKRLWQFIVREKIRQQAYMLECGSHSTEAHELYAMADDVRSGDTTNREAMAARLYFATLFGREFSRETDTPLNASLNYGYAILLSLVNREIVARGYLTQKGICHRNEFNQFNFSCDLMEPFRPLIDRLVMRSYTGDFDKDMKLSLMDFANNTLLYKGGIYKVSSVISLFIQDCFNALNKKIDVDDIERFDPR